MMVKLPVDAVQFAAINIGENFRTRLSAYHVDVVFAVYQHRLVCPRFVHIRKHVMRYVRHFPVHTLVVRLENIVFAYLVVGIHTSEHKEVLIQFLAIEDHAYSRKRCKRWLLYGEIFPMIPLSRIVFHIPACIQARAVRTEAAYYHSAFSPRLGGKGESSEV